MALSPKYGDRKRFLNPEELHRAIDAMQRVAKEKGVRVALAGGVAMQIYGSDRLTQDVDFLGSGTLGNQPVFEIVSPLTFGGLSYKMDGGVPVDLIVRTDAYKFLYDEALSGASKTEEGIPVVSPEHLAVMKFAADRGKDRLDLAYLVSTPYLIDMNKAGDIVFKTLGGQYAVDVFEKVTARMIWESEREKGQGR